MSETLDDLLVRLERAPWSCGVEEGHVLVAEVRRLRDRIAVLDRDGGQTDEAIRLGSYTDEDADNADPSPRPKEATMRETSEAVSIRREIARRVRKTSVAAVSRELDIPEDAIARLAGGAGVRRGTLALARERLARGRDVARPTDAAPGCDGPIAVLDRDGGQTDEAIRLGYYTDEDADNAPRRQDREAK